MIEPISITLSNNLPIQDSNQLAVTTLLSMGGKIISNQPDKIICNFGAGWKIRLLGIPIAGIDAWPRQIIIVFQKEGSGTKIDITIKDTFGFGIRIGFNKKLISLMEENVLTLKNRFLDRGVKETPVTENSSRESQPNSEAVDVEKELEKLKGLLDKGLITQEAYDAKMNKLLGL